MENEVKITVRARNQVRELSGDTTLCFAIKNIDYDKDAPASDGFGMDASIAFIGKGVPDELMADIWAALIARAVEQMSQSKLMTAFNLSEMARHLEKKSEKMLESLNPEEFAEMAAKDLTELFKQAFGK